LNHEVVSIDLLESLFTTCTGSITDRGLVQSCLPGVQVVFHAATLHKPHVATHSRQDFIDTNITGTLHLLEEAVAAGVESFVFTSTTSVFGDALVPPAGAPAAWVTEEIAPVPKNIYGVTKAAAEDLCQLFYRNQRLACVILRTSRFFPEPDDDKSVRAAFADENQKVNESLFRRVDLEDVVSAHLLAAELGAQIGFGRYIISATTPFSTRDLAELRVDAPSVAKRYAPDFVGEYGRRNWRMTPSIDRVYVNEKARHELGWKPRYDFQFLVEQLKQDKDTRSPLARLVGSKGYHKAIFSEGPYPVENRLETMPGSGPAAAGSKQIYGVHPPNN
jgi:nucleoside-diphosphate-sugar epimerase